MKTQPLYLLEIVIVERATRGRGRRARGGRRGARGLGSPLPRLAPGHAPAAGTEKIVEFGRQRALANLNFRSAFGSFVIRSPNTDAPLQRGFGGNRSFRSGRHNRRKSHQKQSYTRELRSGAGWVAQGTALAVDAENGWQRVERVFVDRDFIADT